MSDDKVRDDVMDMLAGKKTLTDIVKPANESASVRLDYVNQPELPVEECIAETNSTPKKIPERLIDEIASHIHETWCNQMQEFLRGTAKADSGIIILSEAVVGKIHKQLNTPYDELSEKEKASDISEANELVKLVSKYYKRSTGKTSGKPVNLSKALNQVIEKQTEIIEEETNPEVIEETIRGLVGRDSALRHEVYKELIG